MRPHGRGSARTGGEGERDLAEDVANQTEPHGTDGDAQTDPQQPPAEPQGTDWKKEARKWEKLAKANNDTGQMIIGVLALLFQVVGVLFTGWGFLLLACLGYIPGFFFYKQARDAEGSGIVKNEVILAVVIAIAGIISIPLTAVGIIPVF